MAVSTVAILVGSIGLAGVINIYINDDGDVDVVNPENAGGITADIENFWEGFEVDGETVIDGDGVEYYNISVNCETDNRSTTTADGIDGDGFATITGCYWENPNPDDDLVIEDLRFDVIETFSIAGTWQAGTTTSLSTQTAYPYNIWTAPDGTATLATSTPGVIASTTVSTTFESEANGMIGVDTEPGGAIIADADEFILQGGSFIVAGWTPYEATSTRSFEVGGGFTGDVIMSGKAYKRGE